MKYILFLLPILLFTACSPKYKTLYSYQEPADSNAKQCIKSCKEKLDTCRKLCKSNFDICAKKAEEIAKKNYEKKLQSYYKALEQYTKDMEMYNLQRDLFWGDDFYYYRRGFGFYGPFGPRIFLSSPSYSLQRPVKPSLQQEILQTQLKECRIDCNCLQSYDNCFTECGGKIIEKKICIENCPK